MTQYISKAAFLDGTVCPTRGWWMLRRDGPPQSLGDRRRMMEGIEVGSRAREVLGPGKIVPPLNTNEAADVTTGLLKDTSVTHVYEALFVWRSFVTKADAIIRSGGRWDLIEVKSSVRDKPELLDDLAYTFLIASEAGLVIRSAKLLLLSKDFRRGDPAAALFTEIDKTSDVQERAESFRGAADHIERALLGNERPLPTAIPACAKCDFFRTKCIGVDLDHSIFEIPLIRGKKLQKLLDDGVLEIRDVPEDAPLTERQRIVWETVRSERPTITPMGFDQLDEVKWPALYLDFETVMTGLPLYDDIAPYTQIPTQYSIHLCSALGIVEEHRKFLADPAKDDRHELASRLMEDLTGDGSIIVYSGFEKRILKELGEAFLEFTESCTECISRLVDLESVIKETIYHPDFRGSTSIKRTLPTLAPDFSYEGLEVQKGDDASAHFAFMALGHYDSEETEKIRSALLEYCKQDTLAMVQLHVALLGLR